MKKRLLHVLALAAIAALVLSACTPPAAAPTATSAPAATATSAPAPTDAAVDWAHMTSAEEGGGMEALIAAAQTEGQLTAIALPDDWCAYGEAIDTFQTKYGLTVTVLDPYAGSSTQLERNR